MIALDGWAKRGDELSRYLAADANAELQMGAIKRPGRIYPDPPATATALIDALPQLKPRNRDLALDGLLRSEARMSALLDALTASRIARESLGEARQKRLLRIDLPRRKQPRRSDPPQGRLKGNR